MFPAKYLIVNADDFNLTQGTSKAILECFDCGIVTSTTLLMTLPLYQKTLQKLKSRSSLGKGIHCSLTLGKPVSRTFSRPFKKMEFKDLKKIPATKIRSEFEAQILKFESLFKQKPSHLDTHHHIHIFPNFFSAILLLSQKYKIPFRQTPNCNASIRNPLVKKKIYLTHTLYEDLDARNHWTRLKLNQCLESLKFGVSEIMTHPGFSDRDLKKISYFTTGREVERRILKDPRLIQLLVKKNIKKINYNDLPYFGPLFCGEFPSKKRGQRPRRGCV